MPISPKSVFVTGGNRGIGLELVKQFLQLPTPPKHVFATCRNPDTAQELNQLAGGNKNLHVVRLDVSDYDCLPSVVESVSQTVGDDGLNLLYNNAGAAFNAGLDISPKELRTTFETNVIAVLQLSMAFLPLLKKAAAKSSEPGMSCSKAAIINMSSVMASLTLLDDPGMCGYKASKAASNVITKSIAIDAKPSGVLAAMIHPGWVQTDMGGANAAVTPQQSVKGILEVLAGLNENKTGSFHDFTGKELPW